jgi:hypothetical protein
MDYRAGGWARARGGGMTVYLKLEPDARGGIDAPPDTGRFPFGDPRPRRGGLRAVQVTVVADGPVTASMWRRVPLAEIERHLAVLSSLTHPAIDEAVAALRRPSEISGFSADALEAWFEKADPLAIGGTIPADAAARGVFLRDRVALEKPSDGRLSDDFLRRVAGIYAEAVAEKEAPAPVMADAAGVSARTVHGWIAEARKRGIMPPATRGRAG